MSPSCGNDFPGIEDIVRIQCLFDCLQSRHALITKLLTQHFFLAQADSMFTSTCSTQRQSQTIDMQLA